MKSRGVIRLKFVKYLQYGFRDTLHSLWRHKGMVLISTMTVAIMLLVLGSTFMMVSNSKHMAENMEDEMEIIVFLEDDVTRKEAVAFEKDLEQLPGYKDSEFIPKEEAMKDMNERFETTDILDETGDTNPLPDAYKIKLKDMNQITEIADMLGDKDKYPEIELVRYGQDVVENLQAVTDTLKIVGVAVVVAMMLIALFLVNSTIRLTVAARGEEISIMKYVGATNLYIRIPFFLEGMIIGFVGGLIAVIILYFGYQEVIEYISDSIPFINLLEDTKLMWKVVFALLFGGTFIGALGSNMATRKYLKA